MGRLILFAISVGLVFVTQVFAGFVGPEVVVKSAWGDGVGQLGYGSEDSGDRFPWKFAVARNGKIAISDELNDRIVIFNNNGGFEKNIDNIGSNMAFDSNGNLYTDNGLMKFDPAGNVVFDKNVPCDDLQVNYIDQIICYDVNNKRDLVFDASGNIINGSDIFKVSYIYPESKTSSSVILKIGKNIYPISTKDDFVNYSVDLNGNIFGLFPGVVEKFSKCGKSFGELNRPDNLVFKGEDNPNFEPYIFYHTEYGDLKVAPNGDIYTWRRTPDTYSILKWTWVDSPDDPQPGPDAPANLTIQPSIDGLYLTWGASPQDPGCVDDYEVERSPSAGGIYTSVKTTDPGVLKFNDTGALPGSTYFYKVRAKSGSTYSPYTAEMSGTR